MKRNNKIIFKQITVLTLGFVLIILSVGSAQQIGARNAEENFKVLQHIITQNNKKFILMTTMREVIRSRILALYDLTLNTDDDFELDDKSMKFSEMAVDYIVARDKLLELDLTISQLEQIENQKIAIKKSQIIFNDVIEAAKHGNKVFAATKITEARDSNQQVLEDLNTMREEQIILANKELSVAKSSYEDAKYQIKYLTISAFILSLVVMGFVIFRISSQASQLNKSLASLADSNLNLEKRVIEKTNQLLSTKQDNMRLTAEIDTSRKLQKILLPSSDDLRKIKNLDISAYMNPASEVGGDYYDVLQSGDRVRIGIGDVTGHGLESGVVMLMAQCLVRAIFKKEEYSLTDTFNIINHTIYENVKRMNCDKNMSLLLLDYKVKDLDGIKIANIVVSGQHESIIIVRADGTLESIDTDDLGFPIGLIDNIDEFLDETIITLKHGDVLVLYTDGITEAANLENKLFGLTALQNIVKNNYQKTSDEIKDVILNKLMVHISDQTIYDDITLIVMKQLE